MIVSRQWRLKNNILRIKKVSREPRPYQYAKASKQGNNFATENLKRVKEKIACSNLGANTPQLFGMAIKCASRTTMRAAAKKAGAIVIQEDKGYWGDKYNSKSLLKDSSELFISYNTDNSALAEAKYTFPSRMDAGQIVRIKNMIASKYGKPDKANGNVNLGDASFLWHLPDNVNIWLERGWPNTTSYLSYINISPYNEQQKEMERQRKNRKQKEYQSQKSNF